MIRVSVVADMRETELMLDRLQREQLPFAAAVALTRTALGLKQDVIVEMARQFDHPTSYALSSTFVRPARKDRLEASVGIKDEPFEGNRLSSAEMFGHQFRGGPRRHKKLEGWLIHAGLMSRSEFIVPYTVPNDGGARIDQYGNISHGQVQQIMSQLRAGPDPSTYSSGSRKSKANVARSGRYFWSRGGRLARGVWLRNGRSVLPVLIVAQRKPRYKRLIDLGALAPKAREHWRREFPLALVQALNSAGDYSGMSREAASAAGRQAWRAAAPGRAKG